MDFARPGSTSRTSATGNQKRRKYRPAIVSGPVCASSATSFASLTWLSLVEVVMARRLYGPASSRATDAVRIVGGSPCARVRGILGSRHGHLCAHSGHGNLAAHGECRERDTAGIEPGTNRDPRDRSER